MENNIGIDSKPRVARRGRRRFSDRQAVLPDDHHDDINDYSIDANATLNVRVKERENDGGRRGRVGSIFKDTPSTSIRSLFKKETSHDLKDAFKRPLTGLFRRPASRSNSRTGSKNESKAEIDFFTPETLTSNFASESDIRRISVTSHVEGQNSHHVANAPSINVSRISAMYHLDFMNPKTASLVKLDDIDLSLLSRFLYAEEEVKDEKVPWTWDYIFASVSTEMREEWAQEEEHEDGGHEDENRVK